MKKKFLILPAIGLASILGVGACFAATEVVKQNQHQIVYAAEEAEEVVEDAPVETFECFITLDKFNNGKVTVDKNEGHIGDIVTITAAPDFLYLVSSVTVNGNALIESETTSGVFSFAMVEGENKISVVFVVDEKLVGVFATMVEQYNNKDWTHLFSVENVLTIIKWVFDGGILIAIIRYFIKDKKLAKNIEDTTKTSLEKLVPEMTKENVMIAVKDFITPIFNQISTNQAELAQAMSVFAKCMALSQENTPESRKAILDELTTVRLGDLSTIEEVKKYIDSKMQETSKAWSDALNSLKNIQENSENIINEKEETKNEGNKEKKYDGTSI